MTKKIKLESTGQRFKDGFIKLKLTLGDKVFFVKSGQLDSQFLGIGTDTRKREPLPEGEYRLGPMEINKPYWPGLGPGCYWWISIYPKFKLNHRGDFGIHLDPSEDGTLGCIGVQPEDDQEVFNWLKKNKPTDLSVRYSGNLSFISRKGKNWVSITDLKRNGAVFTWNKGEITLDGEKVEVINERGQNWVLASDVKKYIHYDGGRLYYVETE